MAKRRPAKGTKQVWIKEAFDQLGISATADQVVQALGKAGKSVSLPLVYKVRRSLKGGVNGRASARAPADSASYQVQDLWVAIRYVQEVGSLSRAKNLLDELTKLQSLPA